MRPNLFFPLCLCVALLGCSEKPPVSPGAATQDTARPGSANVESFALSMSMPDLSVPTLAPRPLIWLDDLAGEKEPPEARLEAQDLMSRADILKSIERFDAAEINYKRAMSADPGWAYPAYQLACNYELWGKPEKAASLFERAVEIGFDDFPTALTDDELGQIRDRADFSDSLATIRQRYIDSSETRVGEPVAVPAATVQPKDGWPLMLLLHGYGDTNLSYLDNAKAWADLGFIAVAVPGSVPAREGRFQWTMESIEPTHRDLQTIIASPLLDGKINRDKVFVLGFSQGALHGMLLAAEHPDVYAGVVAVSPGGSMSERLAEPPLSRSKRPAKCVFIHGLQEPHAPYVLRWAKACRDAGWQFDSKTHPGSHHFPGDWDETRPEVAKFLTTETP